MRGGNPSEEKNEESFFPSPIRNPFVIFTVNLHNFTFTLPKLGSEERRTTAGGLNRWMTLGKETLLHQSWKKMVCNIFGLFIPNKPSKNSLWVLLRGNERHRWQYRPKSPIYMEKSCPKGPKVTCRLYYQPLLGKWARALPPNRRLDAWVCCLRP